MMENTNDSCNCAFNPNNPNVCNDIKKEIDKVEQRISEKDKMIQEFMRQNASLLEKHSQGMGDLAKVDFVQKSIINSQKKTNDEILKLVEENKGHIARLVKEKKYDVKERDKLFDHYKKKCL